MEAKNTGGDTREKRDGDRKRGEIEEERHR
jgi:hypothetical protein